MVMSLKGELKCYGLMLRKFCERHMDRGINAFGKQVNWEERMEFIKY